MKILIASGAGGGTAEGRIGKYFHLKEFGKALKKIGVDYKLVRDFDYITGFPSKSPKGWFSKKKFYDLINEYNPDAVFVDCQSHFGLETIKAGIPLFVYLRGHLWMEVESAKKTIYKDLKMRTVLNLRLKNAERVFANCQGIFMTGDYLEDVIKEHIPNATCYHFLEGLDASRWYPASGMKLEHPCVGLLQDANWWRKTKEMLVLEEVLKKMPDVHFYWAGDGQYKEKILQVLEKYTNFHYLGSLEYPDKVREFLTEIDVYALPTGMDTTPLSCREAMAMQNPVVATKVGGIPEMIYDDETGFLVGEGDYQMWIKKINVLIKDKEIGRRLGKNARELVVEKFNWDKLSKEFVDIIKPYINNKN
ncbi:MAG: glycosyltransferase family 4 protein [Nitrosopumilus sp.]|nr:glycosyltransferase family 4 protein [Nitrosopumilus sp.]